MTCNNFSIADIEDESIVHIIIYSRGGTEAIDLYSRTIFDSLRYAGARFERMV